MLHLFGSQLCWAAPNGWAAGLLSQAAVVAVRVMRRAMRVMVTVQAHAAFARQPVVSGCAMAGLQAVVQGSSGGCDDM